MECESSLFSPFFFFILFKSKLIIELMEIAMINAFVKILYNL